MKKDKTSPGRKSKKRKRLKDRRSIMISYSIRRSVCSEPLSRHLDPPAYLGDFLATFKTDDKTPLKSLSHV